MKKAVLVLDMPEGCRNCKWCENILRFCGISEEFVEDVTIRPDWCPLRELPDRKEYDIPSIKAHSEDWRNGFNACLDAITN